ncbi:MAG: rod shape-determining protein MreC [Ruminococcaceae bacterium]|nr:rod shape-determining protein MreC [Oscillospiraceae bacterium]
MGWGSLLQDVGSSILYPFQWVAAQVENGVTGFISYFQDIQELQNEVEALREENESLKSELVNAEITADENHWLYRYLAMKEEHSDYQLCAATVIASSSSVGMGGEYVTEITLNRGTASGVEAGMPVVTPLGLVGVVVESHINHCRVSTVLDTSVSVGSVVTRSSEKGLCEGDYTLVHNGQTSLRYLPEEADVQPEDIVVTSGLGSVYPYGIPIGRVVSVSSNAYSRTIEAVIQPFNDFSELTRVVILTSYVHSTEGEGSGGGS